jgi:predicted metal-binding protein
MNVIAKDKMRELHSFCKIALDKGAKKAVPIQASDIVIDERVSMKCLVPICSFYGRNLLCPPNLITVENFKRIANLYSTAVLIQIPSSSRPAPPEVASAVSLDDAWEMIDQTNTVNDKKSISTIDYFNELKASQEKLYDIINSIESASLKTGYRFSIGFAAGGCLLCEKCVGPNSGEPCHHPFKARPSMEAMGIDVIGTAENAGIKIDFSNTQSPNWFGLVFIY